MSFQAVIFDFGGVITSSPFEAFNRLETEQGLPRDCVRRINATNPDDNAWARFERAEIDAAAFDQAFADEASALGFAIRGSEVISCLAGDVRPRMVAALDALKAEGLTIGCITNNVRAGKGSAMVFDDARAAEIAAIMARFDHVIESSKAGVRKPDPRIYSMMCKALQIAPQACIYLDDLGVNCKPAAAMGMAAIKVSGEGQALAELRALLGRPESWPD